MHIQVVSCKLLVSRLSYLSIQQERKKFSWGEKRGEKEKEKGTESEGWRWKARQRELRTCSHWKNAACRSKLSVRGDPTFLRKLGNKPRKGVDGRQCPPDMGNFLEVQGTQFTRSVGVEIVSRVGDGRRSPSMRGSRFDLDLCGKAALPLSYGQINKS